MLERWREAFADARVAPLAGAKKALKAGTAKAVWVRLPGRKTALRRMQAVVAADAVPILVLADAPDEEQALELFALGARAYLNTHAAPQLLQRAWTTVEAGGLWVGEALKQRLVRATERLDVSGRLALAQRLDCGISAQGTPLVADRRR